MRPYGHINDCTPSNPCEWCVEDSRDARWMRVVRRLWRQRTSLHSCLNEMYYQAELEAKRANEAEAEEWLESQRQWVDVRERLPDEFEMVFVADARSHTGPALASYEHDELTDAPWWDAGGLEDFTPTHWQPLPDPPKET